MVLVENKQAGLFTTAGLRRRAEGVLVAPEAHIAAGRGGKRARRSDFDLSPELARLPGADERKPAAVLVPVLNRAGKAHVLFTLRTDTMPTHAGQISFPGGRMDPGDADLMETAFREAHEEIGLEREFIEPLGFLDDYVTSTGFHIAPLVALIREGYAIAPDHNEVADVFDVPLAFLMDARNHELHTREWRGAQRLFYAMPYGDRFIWGATAGMLRNLYDSLYSPGARR